MVPKSFGKLREIVHSTVYGQQFLSYNVHSLLHIVADVELLGGLETFSAFCSENNMPKLTKFVRKPGLKLPQVYKRICERKNLNIFSSSFKSFVE